MEVAVHAAARQDEGCSNPRLFNEQFFVEGNAAWVVYMVEVHYDFGEVALDQGPVARCTEIWQKDGEDWKLRHFHCSEHKPGVMGGE